MTAQTTLELVDLAALHRELGSELEAAVLAVVRSGRFVGGEPVDAFESAFADFLGISEVVGVANGTDALQLAVRVLDLDPGAEVLVPANTFIATAAAVVSAGATPRFVDVDPASGLIDLDSAGARLSARTQAIIPVHLYGRMAEMGAIMAFASRHGLAVIEDAAQAHGAAREDRRAGTIGDLGCFSFYPGKNLGAFGDAGAVVTADPALADRLRLLRDHGRSGPTEHAVVGFNSRLDPIQAAVLSVKLPHVARWNRQRDQAAQWYEEAVPAEVLDGHRDHSGANAHHLFPILVDHRDEFRRRLDADGVRTGIHYPKAIPSTAAFFSGQDECPVAELRAARQLSLPMHPHLSRDDVEFIAGRVGCALGELA